MSTCPTRSQCEENFGHSLQQARQMFELKREIERLTDELYLAHEALRREMA